MTRAFDFWPNAHVSSHDDLMTPSVEVSFFSGASFIAWEQSVTLTWHVCKKGYSQPLQDALPHMFFYTITVYFFLHLSSGGTSNAQVWHALHILICIYTLSETIVTKSICKKSNKKNNIKKGGWTMTELKGQWIKDQENSWASWLLQSCAVDTRKERSHLRATAGGEC